MKMIRLAAVLLIAVSAAAQAQNNFNIMSNGKATGSCHYSFDSTKGGYKVSSHFLNHIPPDFHSDNAVTGQAGGFVAEIQGTSSYKLDANYTFTSGSLNDSASQLSDSFSTNKQHSQIQRSQMKAGVFLGDPSQPIPLQPDFVLLTEIDVSTMQGFLYMATTHPSVDSKYFLVLAAMPTPGDKLQTVVAQWAPQADATGTLAGKAVTLHHFGFAYGKRTFNIYGDATNTLMEVDATQGDNTTSYVREGFALDAAK